MLRVKASASPVPADSMPEQHIADAQALRRNQMLGLRHVGGLGVAGKPSGQSLRMMSLSSSGIDRNGECEDSSEYTVVGLPGNAASASSMNLRCIGGCRARSSVHITYVRGTDPQPS